MILTCLFQLLEESLAFVGMWHITPVSTSVFTWPSSLWVWISVSLFYFLIRAPDIGLGLTLIQNDLIITNYICKDVLYKQSRVLRFQVDMDLGGHYSIKLYPFICSHYISGKLDNSHPFYLIRPSLHAVASLSSSLWVTCSLASISALLTLQEPVSLFPLDFRETAKESIWCVTGT